VIVFSYSAPRGPFILLATEQGHTGHMWPGGGVEGGGGGFGSQNWRPFCPRALPTVNKPSRRRHQKPRVLSRHPRI